MLVELCIGNYTTLNGLVNGLDGTFQNILTFFQKPLIWIDFQIAKLVLIQE